MTSRSHLLPCLAAFLITGCTSDVSFPSLAPRAVEGVLAKAPVEVPVAAVDDPAIDRIVATQTAVAEVGRRAFDTALAATRSAIDRPGATSVGTEAWLRAQQALTELGAARGAVAGALGELDAARLAAGARDAPVDMTRLDAAVDQLRNLSAEQDGAYEQVAARLPNG